MSKKQSGVKEPVMVTCPWCGMKVGANKLDIHVAKKHAGQKLPARVRQ